NKGRLVTGSGTLLKSNVSLLKYEQNKASVGNWYARTFGLDFGDNLFGDKDFYQAPKFLPIEAVSSGTRSRVRYAHGIAGQIVGRFNTLLSDPFESEYLGKLVKNVPILERLNLSVKPG
ncbi:hypothetical protein LRR18_17155, partial [Mangrovimonas sp. AS39]|uniref:hypothetical protein n=1 Tax=Mangrovimonas futianensis TaxID=2895523 RepID=UPI001E5CE7F2